MSRGDDPLSYRSDLLGCLPQTQHDFRESLPDMAMLIDSGETQVIERRGAERIEDSGSRCASISRSSRDGVEQPLKFQFGHGLT